MAAYYKLHDAINETVKIRIARASKFVPKNVHYGIIEIEPGKKYYLEGDDILKGSIRKHQQKRPYTEGLENWLKQNGIEYKVTKCPVCGNRAGKELVYKIVEVVEDAEEAANS